MKKQSKQVTSWQVLLVAVVCNAVEYNKVYSFFDGNKNGSRMKNDSLKTEITFFILILKSFEII
jgi:hypothetical protein